MLHGQNDLQNVYNLGVIRHSAGPTAHHFIETSCVHMFFEAYPIPRPEDWHRGLYMIVCVLWAKVVGPDHLTAMRVPHLLGVVSWLVLTVAMVRTISKAWLRPGDKAAGLDTHWACLAAVVLVGLDGYGGCLACVRAWHDDVPAAVCILIALVLLLNEKTPSWRTASMVGLLCGLAFWIKDLYLLWGPIGAVCLGTAMCLRPRAEVTSGSPRRWLCGLAYVVTFAAVAGSRLTWDYMEVRWFLEKPIQWWMIGAFYGSPHTMHIIRTSCITRRFIEAGSPWPAASPRLSRMLPCGADTSAFR